MRSRKSRMRFPKPTPVREAVTLLEVVFSIGVATIGLLAAVALLPVAARQVELGLIADQAAAAGEAAQQNADVIGVRNPLQWRTLVYDNTLNRYVPFVYGRNLGNNANINFDYGFRQAAYDAGVLLTQTASPTYTPLVRPVYSPPINSILIDPYLLSDADLLSPTNVGALSDGTGAADARAQHLAENYDLQLFPYFSKHPYDDGTGNQTVPIFNMRRLSLGSVAGSFAPAISWMNAGQAERLFTVPDDLLFKRTDADRTLPANQQGVTLDELVGGRQYRWTMKRETNRDLSWMVTLVPLQTNSNASTYGALVDANGFPMPINNEIGTNATYTMSIVVHRRRTPTRLNVIPGANPVDARYNGAAIGYNRNGFNGQPSDEMVAQIAAPIAGAARGFLSGGFGGGEVIIESPLNLASPGLGKTPLNHIRANDWVLLSGFSSTSATNFGAITGTSRDVGKVVPPPQFVRHQWYRVVNVGEMAEAGTVGGIVDRHARAVTLEGPDWQVGNSAVQVTIVPSVVAVFEKTVTLAFPLK
jgi:hypothetical protein